MVGGRTEDTRVNPGIWALCDLGTPLVVVLGHSRCGAICAALEELERPAESRSPNLNSIVDRIRPSVEILLNTELRKDRDKLIACAVQADIYNSTNQLRHRSSILERLIQEGRLLVVGAHGELDNGLVDFYLDH